MVVYKLLQEVENDNQFLWMIKKGLIPLSVLDKKCYYERYLQELPKVGKRQAIANTSEDYNVSERTIMRAISFMES